MRNVLDKSCRENQKTHFMFSNPPENRAVYEIVWKNMLELDRPQMVDDVVHAHCMPVNYGYRHARNV